MACLRREVSREDVSVISTSPPPEPQQRSIVQIYTDWANHYLERSRYKRYIQDLQSDITDGVLLADVIDAVAGVKVPDINRKPKTNDQMVNNISACLTHLRSIGVTFDGVTSKEIRDGNLKAILGLFFSLSRYKQAQKAAAAAASSGSATKGASRQHLQGSHGSLASPTAPSTKSPPDLMAASMHAPNNCSRLTSLLGTKARVKDGTASAIPAPAPPAQCAGTLHRRTSPATTDCNNRHATGNNSTASSKNHHPSTSPGSYSALPAGIVASNGLNHIAGPTVESDSRLRDRSCASGLSGIAAPKTSTSCNSSRSGSPHTGSFIPQPKSAVVTRDRTANSDRSRPSSTASSSSISHLPVKNAGVPVRQQPPAQSNGPGNGHVIPKGSHIASAHHNGAVVANHNNAVNHHGSSNSSNNNSMLDKFKFFNSKDKSQDKSKVPKRPSSGGGFSSARSERSDSSVSLCSDAAPGGSPNGPGSTSSSEAASQAKASEPGTAVVCNGGSSNGPSVTTPGNDVGADHGAGQSKSTSSAAKGLAKKTFGRTAGKQQQPGSSVAKVPTSHAGSSETVRSGLPRSSPSTETLNRTATRRPNAGSGHPRPVSSGHELASHVKPEKFPSPKAQDTKPVPNGPNACEDKKHPEAEMNTAAQLNNPGSGIPKPTAAVKGTAKQSREDLTSIGLAQPEKIRSDIKQNGSVPISPGGGEVTAQKQPDVVDIESNNQPIADDSGCQEQLEQTTPYSGDTNGGARTETLPKSDRSKKAQVQGVSIAMVSPIMSSQHSFSKDSVTASSTESSLSTVVSVKEDKASSVIATANQNQQNQHSRGGNQGGLVNGGLTITGPHPENNVVQQSDVGCQNVLAGSGDQAKVNGNGESTATSGLVGGVESTVKSVPAETKLVPRANSVDSSSGKDGDEMEEALANIPPMQPLPRASPYGSGYSRGLSGHRAARLPACLRLQADVQRVAKNMLAASQDIARLYGAQRPTTASVALHHPTYQHLQQQQQQQQHADYAELSAGYVSDGDVLRAPRACSTEESSGYVSEGGIASLYAVSSPCRRPARYAIRDPKLINVLQDDSNDSTTTLVATSTNQLYPPRNCFDDSSSISSGLSDTFAELSTNDNLTDSSLSSDPYGCLKRRPHHPGMAPSGTSGGACNKGVPDRSTRKTSDHHSSGSAIVGGGGGGMLPTTTSIRSRNANVKKTDSSMQTDSSALMQQGGGAVPPHLQSSANWKKYVQQQDLQHQQSKTNSTESLKSKDSKRSGGQSSSSKLGKSADSNRHDAIHSKSGKSRTGSSSSGSGETKLRSFSADTAMIGSDLSLDKMRTSSTAGIGTPVRSSGIEYASTAVVVTNRKLPGRPSNVSGAGPPSACMMVPGKRPSSTASSGSGRSGGSSQAKKDGSAELDQQCRTSSLTRTGELSRGTSRSSLERKAKVSGSTQTGPGVNDMFVSAHSDSEYCSLGRSSGKHAKQYIQTAFGPGGSPALGTMRERIYGTRTMLNGSPPSYVSNSDYVLLSGFQHGTAPLRDRPRLSVPSAKGSESDNYMTLDHSSPYAWLRHSPTSGSASVASAPVGRSPFAAGAGIAEADSMESLSSTASSAHGQAASRYMYLSSPLHSAASMGTRNSMSMSHYASGLVSKMANKDDDAHGSSLSLVSTNSSLYSTTEEKQAHEIRKLRKQLEQANEKVATLTSQLTTNAHMVAAFEQSLSNMTSRLQHLTVTAEQKDSELTELRSTIEALKKQSAEAGLTKMALQSMAAVQRSMAPANGAPPGGGGGGGSTNLVRRHTFNTPKDAAAGALQDQHMSRQLSADSMSSVNSASSACSNASTRHEESCKNKHKKKKGWQLRSSFSKAFSRSKKNRHGSVSDVEDIRALHSDSSTPNSPLLGLGSPPSLLTANGLPHSPLGCGNENGELSHSSYALNEHDEEDVGPELVRELRKQLREKDLVLTDIRLEALSSAHQLDNLKETLSKMRNEMHSLKQDNDRLHRLVRSQSLSASQSSLLHRSSMDMLDKRLSAHEISSALDSHDGINGSVPEGKRVTITVHLVCHGDVEKCLTKCEAPEEALIGSLYVSGKTKWDNLDSAVKKAFKDYVLKVDPASNLGLSSESILCYHIDDIVRSKEAELPELLPCGYLVGETLKIQVVLRGTAQNAVDALALQTLIPKSVIQRYVSLLTEHRRIILCGPSGTGKTFLAQKLAEYLVLRSGRDLAAGSIATFSVDHKSAKELRQYLSNVAEQCENSSASDLPTVIILDNLHHVGSLGEVFNGFLSAKYQKCPYIIGTMNQTTCSTTNLQLHHNFRWVLCANHMEPVKGFLGRFLRRRLVEEEVGTGLRLAELGKVVDWMPRIWHQLNQFLETHSSSDVTIGPRLFLACPMDVAGSQVWFTDLWNYSIVPYLLEAVREGLQLYGRRAAWEDPAEWVLETYPWPGPVCEAPQLLRLRPEDVGYDPSAGPKVVPDQPDSDADPLLNMLMRLQEAASYSSPQTNDAESADLEATDTS
ncbi:neuron navigator 3 isoform X5 [Dermacentor albipictus]|uniref:neuron navigator 3 isoform X5 n=1 Tax=Dermacentor albipictus TaxID=60249 RepID=UPI0038FC9828